MEIGKRKLAFPHVLVLLTIMILIASALTYILPAGVYDTVEGSKAIIPDSFHYIENTPVSPWQALLSVTTSIKSGGLVIALLLILGASTEVLIKSGAIESLTDTGIHRFQDKSIKVVIPAIYLLMSLLGALCGNDSMLAYVAIGVLISRKLKLDRLAAVSMFYLPYITAQAAGPTTVIVLVAQNLLGLQPLSGFWVRIILEICFIAVGMIYTTRYCLRVNADPKNSLLKMEDVFTEGPSIEEQEHDPTKGQFDIKALMAIVVMVAGYIVYAIGAKAWGWSWSHLTSMILIASAVIAVIYRWSPNKFAGTLYSGAVKMGGICLVVGFARTISATLTAGNVIHTIANGTLGLIGDAGAGVAALAIFGFNLIFNFLVPSGTTQAFIVLPIIQPIGDIVGVTHQVMALAVQLGDGLTNCLTPLSAPLMGSLALGGVAYTKWFKYVYKVVLANVVIAGIVIMFAQSINL